MAVYLIYKQYVDHNTDTIKGVQLVEIDKKETEANRFMKLYNLQRTIDEKNTTDYRYMCIDVI